MSSAMASHVKIRRRLGGEEHGYLVKSNLGFLMWKHTFSFTPKEMGRKLLKELKKNTVNLNQ